MNKYINTAGIIFVMIGTIFSLWSVLRTKDDYVGTAYWLDHQQDDFKKNKRKVIAGTILIIIGSAFQIISVFM